MVILTHVALQRPWLLRIFFLNWIILIYVVRYEILNKLHYLLGLQLQNFGKKMSLATTHCLIVHDAWSFIYCRFVLRSVRESFSEIILNQFVLPSLSVNPLSAVHRFQFIPLCQYILSLSVCLSMTLRSSVCLPARPPVCPDFFFFIPLSIKYQYCLVQFVLFHSFITIIHHRIGLCSLLIHRQKLAY